MDSEINCSFNFLREFATMGLLQTLVKKFKFVKKFKKLPLLILGVWILFIAISHTNAYRKASSLINYMNAYLISEEPLSMRKTLNGTNSDNFSRKHEIAKILAVKLQPMNEKGEKYTDINIDKIRQNQSQTVQTEQVHNTDIIVDKLKITESHSRYGEAQNHHLDKSDASEESKKIPQVNSTMSAMDETTVNIIAAYGTTHNFNYLINNNTICDGLHLTYLIYVHTAPNNFARRSQLRETWARNSVIPAYESRMIFMMGTTNEGLQEELYKESKKYGDIIQEDYHDSYRNLTHKAVGALKWITLNCNQVKFVIKTDDDVFVDVFRLLSLIKERYWDLKRYILGHVWPNNTMPILRNPKTCMKWCVKDSEFKGKTYYPKYLSGGFLVISADLIKELYLASKETPFFWVDDVYLTGLLPMKLKNVNCIAINQLYSFNEEQFESIQFDKKNPDKLLVTFMQKKRHLWLKTLCNLPEQDIEFIGKEYHSKLTLEAEHGLQVEKES